MANITRKKKWIDPAHCEKKTRLSQEVIQLSKDAMSMSNAWTGTLFHKSSRQERRTVGRDSIICVSSPAIRQIRSCVPWNSWRFAIALSGTVQKLNRNCTAQICSNCQNCQIHCDIFILFDIYWYYFLFFGEKAFQKKNTYFFKKS